MADFRVIIIYFLWVIQDAVTGAAEAETQLLGYEETRGLTFHSDDTRGRTLITDPSWAFPSDATLTAFNVRLHGNALGSNVTLQIWRPVISQTDIGGTTRYSLVASTTDTDHSTTEHQRVELPVPQQILRGDVIGLYTPGQNPVPFYLPGELPGERDCNETGYLYIDSDAEAGNDTTRNVISNRSDVTRTFAKGGECRRYLVTAEYVLGDTGLQMSIIGDDVKLRTGVDTAVNSVAMPHSDRGFSAPGTLYGWKAFLQQPNQQVVFQVWRLLNSTTTNSTRYVKVHESPPYSQPVPGAVHVRLRENERSEVNSDDVIALGHPLGNPIPYDWSLTCENPYIEARPYNGSGGVEQEFLVATDKQACRKYSFQAEYYRAMPEPLPMENATSTEPNSTTISTEVQVSPTTVPTTALATPTTVATPTSTEAPPTTTPPPTALFGWDAVGASRTDGVRSGTVVPDVGRGFPADGKVIGWVFNASQIDYKIGLQVWRPLPEHPKLSPHARDFAYVGGTKPIRPWHQGENRFTMDQVGELPFPVRRGDVIALRLEASNPIRWVPSSDCSGRYYMDHNYGPYSPCEQKTMQRTAVCRVYPIKAIVLWDDETDKKAPECDDKTSSLVPSPPAAPTKKTHIEGCLILSVKSAGATYQLTNPDYPNITKHRDLCWVIRLEPSLADLYIQIKINDLDLRVPKKCGLDAADFLEVRDGNKSTSSLRRRYCVGWAADGATQTDVITACNHFMYIRLRTSTASYRFKGFKLHYQAVEKSGDGVHCVRSTWPITAPSAKRGRNAAIITVVVVVVVIAAVCLLAYIRKVGFKVPQWLGARFFRHRLFHNQDSSFGQPDSPRHQQGAGLTNPELQPQNNGGLPGSETSGYVTFVPGGYPTHGEPALQLGKLAARPGTNANDSAVMEGITDISEPLPASNGWPQAGNGRAQQGHGANGNSSPQFGISVEDNTGGGYSQNNNGAENHYFNGFDSTASVT